MKNSNEIEIGEFAPKLNAYAESLTKYCDIKLGETTICSDSYLGVEFWCKINHANKEQLQQIEQELTKAFGSEYPKMMLVSDDGEDWIEKKVLFKNDNITRSFITIDGSGILSWRD